MSEANVFLLINLGCEMLYVIEQRLQAQEISEDKSRQVLRDITCALLDPKLIDSLIHRGPGKTVISPDHCKYMLNEIACCSLMRLDEASLGKLWDLMVMIFKWQLFLTKHPQHLIDITFRHLDGILKLKPEARKFILADYVKNAILNFWNSYDDLGQLNIYKTAKSWFEPFSVKISILIRLGFQLLDSSFVSQPNVRYFNQFWENLGENVYNRGNEILHQVENEDKSEQSECTENKFEYFANQLNYTGSGEEIRGSLEVGPARNIVLDDFSVNFENTLQQETKNLSNDEFVSVEISRSSRADSSKGWEALFAVGMSQK